MSLWGSYLNELLDLSFNGVSLQSITGGQITDHNFDEMPEIRSAQSSISASHRSITAGRFFIAKRATVNIAVQGKFHELQAILGRVRQLVQYKNRSLVMKRGIPVLDGADYDLSQTDTVSFKQANIVAVSMNHNAARQTVISIEFLINDPIGIGGTPQVLLDTAGITTGSTTIDLSAVDIQGTFQEQYPVYKITVNSITNGPSPSLTIVNGLSTIVITQQLTASDVLIIDTDEMKVKLNGELVDFDGSFPFISDPETLITITNTFTARNIDIEVKINPRYI